MDFAVDKIVCVPGSLSGILRFCVNLFIEAGVVWFWFCKLSNVSRHFTVTYVVTRMPTKSCVAFVSARGIEVHVLFAHEI